MSALECRRCGSSFTRSSPRGRTPLYCSDGCRKSVAAGSSAAHTASFYRRHQAEVNARRATARAKLRAEVAALKEASPCADCGDFFPSVCMDYDHTGTDKVANVSRMVSAIVSLDLILAEIAKCDLICSNCHRIRTEHRRASVRASAS